MHETENCKVSQRRDNTARDARDGPRRDRLNFWRLPFLAVGRMRKDWQHMPAEAIGSCMYMCISYGDGSQRVASQARQNQGRAERLQVKYHKKKMRRLCRESRAALTA